MVPFVSREERRGRSTLRSRLAGAGMALALAAASVLVAAPASIASVDDSEEKRFEVTSPEDKSTVDSPTPEFTGTGSRGDTIEIYYDSNRGGAFTGNATVDDQGDWTIPTTDFSNADAGQTEFSLEVKAFKSDNSFREQIEMTIMFATPPVTSIDLVLANPRSNDPISGEHVYAVGTGWAGKTVVVEYVNSSGALIEATPEDGSPVIGADGTLGPLLYFFTGLAADQATVKTFWQQEDPDGTKVANRIELDLPYLPPEGAVPPGGTTDPGVSVPGTTAPATGTTAPAAPATGTQRTLAASGAETASALGLATLLTAAGAAVLIARRARASARR